MGYAAEIREEAMRLLKLNVGRTPVEQVIRLRALQELSVLETTVLVQTTAAICGLHREGSLENEVNACLERRAAITNSTLADHARALRS